MMLRALFAPSLFAPSLIAMCGAAFSAHAEPSKVDVLAAAVKPKVIAWRRDVHEHPELGNRETRTAKLVADHLRSLGLDVRTGVAHTGVIGVLRGGRPGPVIGLRADIDALPDTEETHQPFKSLVHTEIRGEHVLVKHACGHDGHVAMLMGVAEALASMRADLPGTVVFVFQPAEEGPPEGEEGGARLMLKENALDPWPEAMFGMHLWAPLRVGEIGYRSGPFFAGSDRFRILVTGRQTHGGQPWRGVDPIVAAAEIVSSMQTIVSRRTNITQTPVVVSVGAIKGGVRYNIIPDTVEMIGTIRTYDPTVREQSIAHLRDAVEHGALANGATATLEITPPRSDPMVNDPALTARMLPTLQRIAGAGNVRELGHLTVAEDFAEFGLVMPALMFLVGITPEDEDPETVPPNHSPRFFVDERALDHGVRAMLAVALDYLAQGRAAP
jgi:amidohydrolase